MSPHEPVATPAVAASEQAFERGDFRALRAQLRSGVALGARELAALRVDPVHVAVLVVCALGLAVLVARYLGAQA
jgi:hypothetical protein